MQEVRGYQHVFHVMEKETIKNIRQFDWKCVELNFASVD